MGVDEERWSQGICISKPQAAASAALPSALGLHSLASPDPFSVLLPPFSDLPLRLYLPSQPPHPSLSCLLSLHFPSFVPPAFVCPSLFLPLLYAGASQAGPLGVVPTSLSLLPQGLFLLLGGAALQIPALGPTGERLSRARRLALRDPPLPPHPSLPLKVVTEH